VTQSLKERLKAGRPALGCLANMASPIATEILAYAGYDCVMIDLEHGPGDVPTALGQIQAVSGTNCAPLIRVPDKAPVHLKRVLDLGPAGVMVPMVNSAEDAAQVVAACRYPPEGIRGVAHPIARASKYGTDLARYLARLAQELLVICQIETLDGVDNAPKIAATDGVDMIFIGPMDLSASAGCFNQPDHADVDALIALIEAATRQAGKLLGILATPGRPAPALFERGFDLVLDAVDIQLLRDAARSQVEASRAFTREQ
jgi:4-hydroxy-2-oxoheptanedioate aldolase